jgi:Raf kinase inhibitor-like YbhB/YbcL family protein
MALAAGAFASGVVAAPRKENRLALQLISQSFRQNGEIPARNTCDAEDLSPALMWSGAPAGTKSFAVIVEDPDAPDPKAPEVTWAHWVLYDIPVTVRSLPEGITAKTLPAGTLEGLNDWKKTGYRGPCPPVGRHRYFHKLYALDTKLPDLNRPTRTALQKAMEGHVLAKAELVGTYRPK